MIPWRSFQNPLPRLTISVCRPLLPTAKRPLTNSSPRTLSIFQSYPSFRLLNHCRNSKDLKSFASLLIVRGLTDNESLIGDFLLSCSALDAPYLALSALQNFQNPSLYLQNVVVRCLCNHGLYEDLLAIYKKCRNSGCPSDGYTFPFVIKACTALSALWVGKQAHCVILKTGFEANIVVQTALVDFYVKSGCFDGARLLFDAIPEPDMVSFNALLSGYSLNGRTQEAFGVFQHICKAGLKPNVSTLASMIPLCSRVGLFSIGQSLHGFSFKSGFLLDDSLAPALISMYAGYGELSLAINMFESSCQKNIAVWNAMISAYTQNEKSYEAFDRFWKMLQTGLQPNIITFVSILSSWDCQRSFARGESLHAYVFKCGLEYQISVMTALSSMYAKLGEMNSSELLFEQMQERSILAWNSMISGYVHNGFWDAGFAAFYKMQSAGFEPDVVSVVSIISACSKLRILLLGKSAHAYSLKKDFDSNINICNALLALYSECSRIGSSFKLFHRMPIRNTISWNTLITGCVDKVETEIVVSLLQQMQQDGVELDFVTLISILPSYNEDKNLKQGMAVHCYAIKAGFVCDVSLANALISMYINCGDPVAAELLFEMMPERDVISWNALMTGYRLHYLHSKVMILFNQMMKEGHKPNYVTLLNMLPSCCKSQGKSVHAYAIKMEPILEIPLLTSLIFMYAKFGKLRTCYLLFQMGGKRNISLWNAIISVHVQSENAQRAVSSFCELHQMGIQPDHVTFLSLISACIQLTDEKFSWQLMAYAIQKGFDKDVGISNALIDLYARSGNISIARKLFEGLSEKNVVSWSIMINGHGMHGDIAAALDLLSQMKLLRMRPDSVTYLSALAACSHAGLVEQSKVVFSCMLEDGIMPRPEHYSCMVDLLGRTGHLGEACDIVKNLPFQPSISLLESLLGACRIHGNVVLGEEIGALLFKMDPENSVPYVMLHNIYAAAGRWTDANRIRSTMEGKKLRKAPGLSLVEGNKLRDELLA